MAAQNYTPLTPHGDLEPVLDDVFVVQGSFKLAPLIRIPRTMCIVRRGSSLTVINSVRVDEQVEAQIATLGTIEHLVRLGHLHGCDDAWYLDRHGPTYWSLANESRPGADHDATLSTDGPSPLDGARLMVFKATQHPEAALWIPDAGGTLITCDSLQNPTNLEHASVLARPVCRMLGFVQTSTAVPMWRKRQGRVDLWPDFERLLSLDFDNLVTAHGPADVGNARTRVAANLAKIWPRACQPS